jgi:hypothetical protein
MEPFTLPTLYSGVDQLGIVGTVAPGIFAQTGRCRSVAPARRSGQLRNQGKYHGVLELRLHHGVQVEVLR